MDSNRGILAPTPLTDPIDDYKKLVNWFDVRKSQLDKLILKDSGVDSIESDETISGTADGMVFGSYTLDGKN